MKELIKTAALAIAGVFVATSRQLLLRAGMQRVGYIGMPRLRQPVSLLVDVAKQPRVVLGLGLFVLSAAMWLIVLSRIPLSLAYPFVGLTYVLTALFGRYILHERVPAMRWFGIALILTGIIVVGRSAPPGLE